MPNRLEYVKRVQQTMQRTRLIAPGGIKSRVTNAVLPLFVKESAALFFQTEQPIVMQLVNATVRHDERIVEHRHDVSPRQLGVTDVRIVAQMSRLECGNLNVGSELLKLMRRVTFDSAQHLLETSGLVHLIPWPCLAQRLPIANSRQTKEQRLHANRAISTANDRALPQRECVSLKFDPTLGNASQSHKAFAIEGQARAWNGSWKRAV